MLRGLKNDEKGIVFVTVLLIIIVMMVLTVSVISMNVTQVTSTEREIKRIRAESLAMGMVAYVYANQQAQSFSSPNNPPYSYQRQIENSTYQVNGALQLSSNAFSQPNNLVVTVTY